MVDEQRFGRSVVVIDDDGKGIPRLLVREVEPPARAVTWRLLYGGVVMAQGSIPPGEQLALTPLPGLDPGLDGRGLRVVAFDPDGRSIDVEATCVRPARPTTRAEATAQEQWGDVVDQAQPPRRRAGLLVRRRKGRVAGDDEDRRIALYRSASALVARRKEASRPAPPRAGGPATAG